MMSGRRFLVLGAAACALAAGSACQAASRSVAYETRWAGGVRLHVVTVNLNDPETHITFIIARRGIGSSEPFASMLHRAHPAAAITGTFFCLRTLLPTGDLVIEGERVYRGVVGPAIAITPYNKAAYIPSPRGGYERDYASVICGGPTLVRDGKIALNPRGEGFTEASLLRAAPRTAVGITRYNKLLLVAVSRPVRLGQLARAMRALGARHAVSMDGGTSAALAYRGQILVRPHRALTNVLAVYATQKAWQQAKARPPVG